MKFIKDYNRYKKSVGYKSFMWWVLDQSFWVILIYRCLNLINRTVFWPFAKILEKVFEFIFKCYIPSGCVIGEGLIIYHAFNIIINGKSEIGKNCTIYSGVCIGNRWPGDLAPKLGDNVIVGTGAKIFGPVYIPSGTFVAANSVITPKNITTIKNGECFDEC